MYRPNFYRKNNPPKIRLNQWKNRDNPLNINEKQNYSLILFFPFDFLLKLIIRCEILNECSRLILAEHLQIGCPLQSV